MEVIDLILLILGFACFLLAALSIPVGRLNLTAAGLAFWILVAVIHAVPK
jgi:hypothetical protein